MEHIYNINYELYYINGTQLLLEMTPYDLIQDTPKSINVTD